MRAGPGSPISPSTSRRSSSTSSQIRVIGTSFALTGNESLVDASFTSDARYMSWPLGSLSAFMEKRPDLRVALQGLTNRDLAGKLERLLVA